MSRPIPLSVRIWRHIAPIVKATDCWLWTGAKTDGGYGCIKFSGRAATTAHRAMWVLVHGPIADGLVVCHDCDTPACVNPSHLFLGTQQDNVDDKMRKGRYPEQPKGEQKPNAKLTAVMVRQIRASVATWRELAETYGVTIPTIQAVKSRRTWRHVA